jgi:phenylacetate-CoA ligase
VRDVVSAFSPAVSGHVLVRPASPGVKQEPPLPILVELGREAPLDTALAAEIREKLREALVVQMQVELVPFGSLQRSEYKSTLITRETENP